MNRIEENRKKKILTKLNVSFVKDESNTLTKEDKEDGYIYAVSYESLKGNNSLSKDRKWGGITMYKTFNLMLVDIIYLINNDCITE